jgi:DNA-binding Lrp family transcriptional regulator
MAFRAVDSIDRSILFHLQRDGRQANNTLAELVGLSPSPCLRRVRQLEADGVIEGYTALLDRRTVGCGYEALVWVTLTQVTRDSMTDFEGAVGAIDAIVEVLRMMGQPDYLLRVVAADAEAFEAVYIDRLAQLPHVKTLTSQSAMKVVKRTHVLPIPAR